MRSERFDTDHNMLTRNYLTEYDPFTGKESVCEGMSNVYNKVQNINVPETPCNPTRYVRCVRARPTDAEVQSAIEKRKIQQQQQEEQQRLAEQKRIEEERLMAEQKRIEEEKGRKLLAADLAAWTDAKEKNTRDSYNEYLNNNPHGKYIEPAKRALNSMPKDAEYYRALGDSYYNKGNLCKTGNDKDLYSALSYYQKAAELDPGNTEYNNLILRSYSSLGSYWRQREDYSTAINYYKKALELNPTDAYTYVWAGNAFFENRDAVNGELCYKKAIEIDPKNTSFVKFVYNMFRNDYVNLMNKLYKEGERKTVKGMQGKLKEIETEQQRIEENGALAK